MLAALKSYLKEKKYVNIIYNFNQHMQLSTFRFCNKVR